MFVQDQELNILKCNGCQERCELGACNTWRVLEKGAVTYSYMPTIGGQTINLYKDQNGKSQTIPTGLTPDEAIEEARKICRFCDNYKTAQKTL